MKRAAKILLIIGLLMSIGVTILGVLIYVDSVISIGSWIIERDGFPVVLLAYIGYVIGLGAYGIFFSILSLNAISGESKAFVIVCGIFYLPILLPASIVMFLIKDKDLIRY